MTARDNTVADGELQFDRVAQASSSITCAKCSRVVTTYYYTVDDASVCSSCKRAIDAEWARRKTGIWRAAAYGFGAAVVGAAIYYGVIAITNLEIGIVALLIGYMVGYAVRRGAGRGGRRLQVLAAALTYLSVGMAYSPLALKPILTGHATSLITKKTTATKSAPAPAASPRPAAPAARSGDSAAASPPPVASTPRKTTRSTSSFRRRQITLRVFVMAVGALVLFVTILPIVAIIGSMPAGLISALIIGIGMLRAWRMTADTGSDAGVTVIAGPFRVGKPVVA
jgi:hypothetical protein